MSLSGLLLQHMPGAEFSPIIHLHLAKPPPQELQAKHLLLRLSDHLLEVCVGVGVKFGCDLLFRDYQCAA